MKEQILIRYLGLGWEEAYHPWSQKGHGDFSPVELLEHLTLKVIPLQGVKSVPPTPPVHLPGRPEMKQLGTQALDVKAFDNQLETSKTQVILDTMKEREKLEDDGIDDQVEYMNAINWPIERIGNGSFLVEKLFDFKTLGESEQLVWCRGVVKQVYTNNIDDDTKQIKVKVNWDEDCLEEGEAASSNEILLKSKFNPSKPTKGAWRENLRHKIL